MDSNLFLQLLKTPGQLGESDYLEVKQLQANYPYFHLAHGLSAKFEFEKNGKIHGSSLAMAALTSPDRIKLKKWIELPLVSENPSFDVQSSLVQISENKQDIYSGLGVYQGDQNESKSEA